MNVGLVRGKILKSADYEIQPSEYGPMANLCVVSKLNRAIASKGMSGEEKSEPQALLQSLES